MCIILILLKCIFNLSTQELDYDAFINKTSNHFEINRLQHENNILVFYKVQNRKTSQLKTLAFEC
jgi:hypothetical protein